MISPKGGSEMFLPGLVVIGIGYWIYCMLYK